MNLEALQLGKSTAKKKEDSLVQDLIITFDVLRNLLFMNEDAKVSSDLLLLHLLKPFQRNIFQTLNVIHNQFADEIVN